MSWFKSVLIAMDQLANALCGGWPDETLSSVAYRWHKNGVRTWPMWCINFLFFDGTHCKDSYFSELKRMQVPPELRQ